MTAEIPIPTQPFSEEYTWPRQKPVFTLLAFLLALICGAATFAWQYQNRWTPLQRYYFPTYLRTALRRSSSKHLPGLPSSYLVLTIAYRRGSHIAIDSEVLPAPPPAGVPPRTVAFRLSPEAIKNGAQRLLWQRLKLDDEWLHAWFAHWIYEDCTVWQFPDPYPPTIVHETTCSERASSSSEVQPPAFHQTDRLAPENMQEQEQKNGETEAASREL